MMMYMELQVGQRFRYNGRTWTVATPVRGVSRDLVNFHAWPNDTYRVGLLAFYPVDQVEYLGWHPDYARTA